MSDTNSAQPLPNPLHELGRTGLKLPACGYGTMSLMGIYGAADDTKSAALLRQAIQLGCTFWDSADVYGQSEDVIGPILRENRDKIFICTKFALSVKPDGTIGIRGDKEYVHEACNKSLKRLGVDYIDLYYQHRVDPNVTIEETVTAMKELQDAGKVKHLGLSECSAETLERALKIARIEAVQIEYSPWETGPERSGLLEVMRKHGVSLVAYSPLGRGMLTGAIKSHADLAERDYRKVDPRYQGEAFNLNMRLVDKIAQLAAEKSKQTGTEVKPASFCLAWVLFQGKDFFVIPGTRSVDRLEENLQAGRVLETFTKEDDEAVRNLIKEIQVAGERYPAASLATTNA